MVYCYQLIMLLPRNSHLESLTFDWIRAFTSMSRSRNDSFQETMKHLSVLVRSLSLNFKVLAAKEHINFLCSL